MQKAGDYLFTVNVTNGFYANLDVILNVTHYFHGLNEKGGEVGLQHNSHTIMPGQRVGYFLYQSDEYLEISIAKPERSKISEDYYIWAGMKAKIYFTKSKKGGNGATPSGSLKGATPPGCFAYMPSPIGDGFDNGCSEGKDCSLERHFYRGGTFKFSEKNTDWTMEIHKYDPDPESDDVVVGTIPPA